MSTAHVVIAVKDLATAKTRLADSFSETDRARLVVAMLQDTVRAAQAVEAVASITVVTPDPEVAEIAHRMGARVVADPSPDESLDSADRLNSAFSAAVTSALTEDGHDIIALQADLPALRTEELTQAYESARPAARSVVADHHGTGTAALILTAGTDDLTPLFGPASARRHRESGAHDLVGEWPGLRLDVDTLDDVRQAYSLGVGPATTEVLRSLGW
ncbi:2-phospho-L-lactate guanylyltransferase [Rhodococcoides yunnanense]|uniref:2-phospho-L-lactate guanylyltransferase n=1 Tax=Rhodococcoides yunnanense TaxID=278209 RepID=UPI000932862C|nr:2-phospho-L-lactate guanylyltransferase [Rhodococcus yunnanensis]